MHTRALPSTVLCRTVLSVLVGVLSIPTLAQSRVGSGPAFRFPVGIEVEATGTLVVVDVLLVAVLRVDPITGDRTVVSDASTGSGPALSNPEDITVEASDSLVVLDLPLGAVLRVDPITGDRTVVSGCTVLRLRCPGLCLCPPPQQVGSGPALREFYGIAVEATGSLVVIDLDRRAVVRVDPVTGDRTVVSK